MGIFKASAITINGFKKFNFPQDCKKIGVRTVFARYLDGFKLSKKDLSSCWARKNDFHGFLSFFPPRIRSCRPWCRRTSCLRGPQMRSGSGFGGEKGLRNDGRFELLGSEHASKIMVFSGDRFCFIYCPNVDGSYIIWCHINGLSKSFKIMYRKLRSMGFGQIIELTVSWI